MIRCLIRIIQGLPPPVTYSKTYLQNDIINKNRNYNNCKIIIVANNTTTPIKTIPDTTRLTETKTVTVRITKITKINITETLRIWKTKTVPTIITLITVSTTIIYTVIVLIITITIRRRVTDNILTAISSEDNPCITLFCSRNIVIVCCTLIWKALCSYDWLFSRWFSCCWDGVLVSAEFLEFSLFSKSGVLQKIWIPLYFERGEFFFLIK